jgi:hypothetical protein
MSRSPSFNTFVNLYGMALSSNQTGNEGTTGASTRHQHSFSTSFSGSSGSTGGGSSFDIRPKYMTTVYVMRVK